MILYWVLLLITAAIAYLMGSLDTMVIASNFVFHRSLKRLGKSNVWLSNFYRVYGIGGFVKLLLIEVIRDAIPILIGGLLLGVKEHGDVGRAFAGFCLVLGRLYPIYYSFRGGHASLCLVAAAFGMDSSVGAATLFVVVVATWFTKFVSLGSLIEAIACGVVSVMVLEGSLMIRLALFTSAIVIIKHIPAVFRIAGGKEEKLGIERDITYKLDEKF